MDCLKKYLQPMTPEQKSEFALRCGTTIGYLKKIFSTGGSFGPEICVAIESQSAKKVTRQDLRPNDFWLIWPELKTKK